MGLFDNIASAVGNALGGDKNPDGSAAGAQDILGNLLKQGGLGQSGNIIGQLLGGLGSGQGAAGGMAGVLESLAASGLGAQVSSWMSNNPNLPVSPEQLRDALGSEQVHQLAQQSGLPVDQFLQHLAEHLPQAASEAAGTPAGGSPDAPA